MKYFVTAIDTDSGKTLVSAILVEMLGCHYWKPIQSGPPRDTETVQSLVSHPEAAFHPEQYVLSTPASPHYSAEVDKVQLRIADFKAPEGRPLIIEGAGGVLVPINTDEVVIDLATHLEAEVVLVANLYLGSINHTLLTVEELRRRRLPIKGILFNGPSNRSSEEIILHKTGLPCLMKIPQVEQVDRTFVRQCAAELKTTWT